MQKYAKTLAWLWGGDYIDKISELPRKTMKELLLGLQAVTVDLSEENSDLKVVRVLSPKLVPINFGFYSAHYTHPELTGKVHPKSLELPHYFA